MTITFTPGAVIPSTWLNDLNTVAYTYFGDGTNLNSPTKLTIGHVNAGSGLGLLLGSNNLAQWNIVAAGHLLTQSGDNVLDIGASGSNRPRTGYFGTSVVTPQIGNESGTTALRANGATAIQFSSSAFNPNADLSMSLGLASLRFNSVFTPIIDSGTTGSLSLRTNNGTLQMELFHVASAVNYFQAAAAPTAGTPTFGSLGADTDVGLILFSKGAGAITLKTGGAARTQFQILDTASANRNITVTGSNGGNPTIAATAGSPAIVYASAGGSGTPTNHTLSMYEEGTWTPSLGGNTTYTVLLGTYTKIGNLVFIQGTIIVNVLGTGSTGVVSGLPFTPTTTSSIGITNTSSLATAVVSTEGRTDPSFAHFTILSRTAANASAGVSAIFGNGTALSFSGCYNI